MKYHTKDPLQDIASLFGMESLPSGSLKHEEPPEWFPSNNLDVNQAWMDFAIDGAPFHAMLAIEVIMEAGLPLPKELVPWVHEAIDAWRNNKGNKQRAKTPATADKWQKAVGQVYLRWLEGVTVDEAVSDVAGSEFAKDGKIKDKNLKTEYKRGKYKDLKFTLYTDLMAEYVSIFQSGNAIHKILFEDRWPRVMQKIKSDMDNL